MNTQASLLTVTRGLVPEDRRMDVVEKLFGTAFPLQLEPVVYGITDRMAGEYTGGYWHFYTLSNGGFYMAPAEDTVFHVKCQNMYEGDLSVDALGITACLYAYSNLSFSLSDIAREYARALPPAEGVHGGAPGGQGDPGGHRLRVTRRTCRLPRVHQSLDPRVAAGAWGKLVQAKPSFVIDRYKLLTIPVDNSVD